MSKTSISYKNPCNENLLSVGSVPFTATTRDSPIIILGAHNGHSVPSKLYDIKGNPLGVESKWFNPSHPEKRHEACDWGMQELFVDLEPVFHRLSCSTLEAHLSRLVVDLNRTRLHCLAKKFDELGIEIPENVVASEEDIERRKQALYDPWFHAIGMMIDSAKKRYGYAVIVDLHSFSPRMRGHERILNVGSISPSETPFAAAFDEVFAKSCSARDLTFESDAPYSVRSMREPEKMYAYGSLCAQFSVAYHGIEIRNDLVQNVERRAVICDVIEQGLENLFTRQDIAELAQPA